MSLVHGSGEGRRRSLFAVGEQEETTAEAELAAAPASDVAAQSLGHDISTREMVAALLEHAVTDQLTGLPSCSTTR